MLYMTQFLFRQPSLLRILAITFSAQELEAQQRGLCTRDWVDFPESSETLHSND